MQSHFLRKPGPLRQWRQRNLYVYVPSTRYSTPSTHREATKLFPGFKRSLRDIPPGAAPKRQPLPGKLAQTGQTDWNRLKLKWNDWPKKNK